MRRSVSGTARAGIALAAILLAGCAQGGAEQTTPAQEPAAPAGSTAGPPTPLATTSAAGRPTPPSATSPPVLPPPSGPPRTPTDPVVKDGWVVGTITRGGSGPCYGLETDDGVEYAMHSVTAAALDQGTRVRARVSPIRARIACGAGHQVKLEAVELVR